MEMNLAGKQVVVCGAARGIGRSIAAAFRAEGSDVVGFDLKSPDLDADPSTPEIRWLAGDITDRDDVARILQMAPAPDHVVFAVGLGSGKAGSPFWNLDPSDWTRVIDVNLIGAVNLAHAFAPIMAKRGCGTFTFLVSVAGQIGSPTDPPYSAAKAGLINFMQVVARDLAPYGVRSNAISPGMVQTDLNQSVWRASQQNLPAQDRQSYGDWADEKIRRVCPLGRWQTAEEIAATAVFLASDQARNLTGQTINVDGGQVMHC
ncbi:MAG: SDR family oxidoreductase [Planctomycetales bacterium]|nr:SDR family oxidoreductase [Planctomycetales bacterium]